MSDRLERAARSIGAGVQRATGQGAVLRSHFATTAQCDALLARWQAGGGAASSGTVELTDSEGNEFLVYDWNGYDVGGFGGATVQPFAYDYRGYDDGGYGG